MKRGILLLIVLTLILSLFSMPMIFAESDDIKDASVSINEVSTPAKDIDLRRNNGIKSIDMFVGESVTIKTDLHVNRTIVIEDTASIKGKYNVDTTMFDASYSNFVERDLDTPNYYIRREMCTLTAKEVGKSQIIVYYTLGDSTYFDSLDINVVTKDITSISLRPNVTTLRTNATNVNFDLVINGSTTLSTSDAIDVYINDIKLESLEGYTVPSTSEALSVKIVYGDKTFTQSLEVVEGAELGSISTPRESYGFLLKNESGKIALYTSANAYPNISIISDNDAVTLVKTEKVESDSEGMDKYELSLKLNKAVTNDKLLIRADNKSIVCKLNIIDNIISIGIVPEDTKFESNKVNRFHVVINGVKDVDTAVKWSVNGTEMKETGNVLEYKSISMNAVKVTATVEDSTAEYNYTIDTSTSSIILTVVASLVVIIICIPILIALKKSPKPNLKAMIVKDSTKTIEQLDKLKKELNESEPKSALKQILKVDATISRSEKRAQQESFDCENKAFNTALSNLSDAKVLADELVTSYKTNKDITINKIDTIIDLLNSAIATINKVEENMK